MISSVAASMDMYSANWTSSRKAVGRAVLRERATPGATSVRVFGDTAVLMGSIKTAGAPQPKDMRVTLVCQKRPQGWQMIAAHLAPGAPEE